MTKNPAPRERDIFIVNWETADPGTSDNIYEILREANIIGAYKEEPGDESFNIGLSAVVLVIEQLVKIKPPDIIYLETSLFPEKTRFTNRFLDFLAAKINDQSTDETALSQRILDAYRLVYPTLHETNNTIYYVPRFFQRAKTMQMVFSEYPYPEEDPDASEIERKVKDLEGEIEKRKGLTGKEGRWLPRPNGVLEARLPLEAGEGTERGEQDEDLHVNTVVFHELFHKHAFPEYARSFLWCIPIVGAASKGERYLAGQGALFVLLVYKDADVSFSTGETINIAGEIARTASYLLKDIFISYLYISAQEMLKEAINRSLRSAVAAIMARNMSHNIGSHVLAYLSDEDEVRNLWISSKRSSGKS